MRDEGKPATRSPGRRRLWLFRVLSLFLVFWVSFLLLELILRIAPQVIPISLLVDFSPDVRAQVAERLGLPTAKNTTFLPRDDGGPPRRMRVFRPRATVHLEFDDPGFVKEVVMDENGFCNPGPPPAEGTSIPVVALGDSFTWCLGVRPEETWVAGLSARLGVRAYNLGTIAIGPYEHLQLLKKFGAAWSPEIVILNFYEGNDLRDALAYHEYRQMVEGADYSKATLQPEGSDSYATIIRRFLNDRPLSRLSYAYNLIYSGVRACRRWVFGSRGRNGERTPNFHYRVRTPTREIPFNPANMDHDEVLKARSLRAGEIHPNLWEASLREFVALSRRHHFAPVVAYTPSAHTAYAGRVVFEDPNLAELLAEFSRVQRNYLSENSEELGYSFVDLTPALQAAARDIGVEELLYFTSNLHLTQAGHRVIADALDETLRRLEILPSPDTVSKDPPR